MWPHFDVISTNLHKMELILPIGRMECYLLALYSSPVAHDIGNLFRKLINKKILKLSIFGLALFRLCHCRRDLFIIFFDDDGDLTFVACHARLCQSLGQWIKSQVTPRDFAAMT
jgi:hypothetical protein